MPTSGSPPAGCRGWPAPGPGRLPPGPCLLAGVSVEAPGSSVTSRVRSPALSPVLVGLRLQSRLGRRGGHVHSAGHPRIRAQPGLLHLPPVVILTLGMLGIVFVCGLSPLETGCTGNSCRVPRRQQGGQKRGAAEPIDAGSGAAAPVRDRAEGRWQQSRRNCADPPAARRMSGGQYSWPARFLPDRRRGGRRPGAAPGVGVCSSSFPSPALDRRPPRSRLAAPCPPVTGMTTVSALIQYGLFRQLTALTAYRALTAGAK